METITTASFTLGALLLYATGRVNVQQIFDRDPYESRRTAMKGSRLLKVLVFYQLNMIINHSASGQFNGAKSMNRIVDRRVRIVADLLRRQESLHPPSNLQANNNRPEESECRRIAGHNGYRKVCQRGRSVCALD